MVKYLVSPDIETVPGTYTMALIWRITKPLWVTCKTVIMDCGFCVLKLLIGIYERVLYGNSVVKKYRYWTRYSPRYLLHPHSLVCSKNNS